MRIKGAQFLSAGVSLVATIGMPESALTAKSPSSGAATAGGQPKASAADAARAPDIPVDIRKQLQSKLSPKLPVQTAKLDRGPIFIENKGQFNEKAKFQVRSAGKTLWLTNEGVVFDVLRSKADPKIETGNSKLGPDFRLPTPDSQLPFPGLVRGPRTPNPEPQQFERLVFSQQFIGANPKPAIEASGCQPGIYNYLFGNDSKKWVTHVKAYSEVIYRNLWPGVDLRLRGNPAASASGVAASLPRHDTDGGVKPPLPATDQGQGTSSAFNPKPKIGNPKSPVPYSIEQEFIIHPGADLSRVHVAYQGIDRLEVAADGSLVVHTAWGEMRELKPRIYQEIAGQRVPVEGRFRLTSETAYAFDVGPHDPQFALVIDPSLLYSTYLGGSYGAEVHAIAVDSGGNTYLTGATDSTDFPTTIGSYQPNDPDPVNIATAFVTKLNPLGSHPVYSTYLSSGLGRGIAVDAAGEAYVTGATFSPVEFPTTTNRYQACDAGLEAPFVAKLKPDGSGLLYSTCLGGDSGGWGLPGGWAIAVDASSKAYITGYTADRWFPTTASAFQPNPPGGGDAFLAEIDPSLPGTPSLVYSTYLGGSQLPGGAGFAIGRDIGYGIAVDSYGMVYVTGGTESSDFPVTPGALQTTFAGSGYVFGVGCCGITDWASSAFVAKFNPSASGSASLIYSTFLGGSTGAIGYAVAVDANGNAYVAGATEGYGGSPVFVPFPTTSLAFQADNSAANAFVTKLNAAGNNLVYSTVLGDVPAWGPAAANGIAIDALGHAYVTGYTRGLHFPVTTNAFAGSRSGGGDDFLTEFDQSGSPLVYSTYFGGSCDDYGYAIAVDPVGDAYVTGMTASPNFPTTVGALQVVNESSIALGKPCEDEGFVTKFPLGAPQGLSILGMSPNFGGNAGSVSPQIVGAGFHAGATVKLTGGSGGDIIANPVNIGIEGRTINATFNLTSAAPGLLDLVITNPDGTTVTLSQAFTVQQGGAADVRVHETGFAAVPGANVSFFITVDNSGNVDSTDGILSALLEKEFSLTSVNPPALADVSTLAAGSIVVWSVPRLAAGGARTFSYQALLDASTPVGSTVVGGPGCYLLGLDIAVFFGCLAGNKNCRTWLTVCGSAGVACAGCLGGSALSCGICLFGVLACLEAGSSCPQPVISGCLQLAALSCHSFPEQVVSLFADPNYLVGSTGAGGARWVAGAQPMTYAIHFENEPTAGLPAQNVVVTDRLNPRTMDFSTLRVTGIIIGDKQIPVPPTFLPAAGLNQFSTNVDLRGDKSLPNIFVQVSGNFEPKTGLMTWNFVSIDPTTSQPPINPSIGFLMPGGEAGVIFTVKPRKDIATGTQVTDQGSVVFSSVLGTNPPVPTNFWGNTIDNTKPVSHVSSLPASVDPFDFNVKWTGTDVGSGVGDYTIYVSDNGGPYQSWQKNTKSTSAIFTGEEGHTYSFYSRARDLAGNLEDAHTTADATTAMVNSEITVAPEILGFGSEPVGNRSVAKTITLTNSAGGNLRITAITSQGDFIQTNNCRQGVIPVGASCTISVVFAPMAVGERDGAIIISDNRTGSPQIVALSGTGAGLPVPAQKSCATCGSSQH